MLILTSLRFSHPPAFIVLKFLSSRFVSFFFFHYRRKKYVWNIAIVKILGCPAFYCNPTNINTNLLLPPTCHSVERYELSGPLNGRGFSANFLLLLCAFTSLSCIRAAMVPSTPSSMCQLKLTGSTAAVASWRAADHHDGLELYPPFTSRSAPPHKGARPR
jgi:hypothetical protein